mgnify:CR=1 FL=1
MLWALAGAVAGWIAAEGRKEKAQDVRLLDVWLVGPLLILVPRRQVVQFIGGATIGYNGRTYLTRRNPAGVV